MITLREVLCGLIPHAVEGWTKVPNYVGELKQLAQELLEYECGLVLRVGPAYPNRETREVELTIRFGPRFYNNTISVMGYVLRDGYSETAPIYYLRIAGKTSPTRTGNMDMIKRMLGQYMIKQGLAVPRRRHTFQFLWFKPEIKEIT